MDTLGTFPKTKSAIQQETFSEDRKWTWQGPYQSLQEHRRASRPCLPTTWSRYTVYWLTPWPRKNFDSALRYSKKYSSCPDLGVKHFKMTAYDPLTNDQVVRFPKTIIARLGQGHSFAEHHTDCDKYVQLLTYSYSAPVQEPTDTTQLKCVLSRQAPGLTTSNTSSALADARRELFHLESFWTQFPHQLDVLATHVDAKNCDYPGWLQSQHWLNCPTHNAVSPWTRGVCWQTTSTNDCVSTNSKHTAHQITANKPKFVKCNNHNSAYCQSGWERHLQFQLHVESDACPPNLTRQWRNR